MWAGVLLLEYLTVSFLFDAQPLRDAAHGWFGYTGALGPALVAVGAGALVVGAGPDRRGLALPRAPRRQALIAAMCQVSAFAILVAATAAVVADMTGPVLIVWLGALLAVLGATFAAVVDLRTGTAFDGQLARTVGLAAAVGISAYVAGQAATQLWEFLAAISLRGAALLLLPFGDLRVVIPEERLLGLGNYLVEVTSVCSGVEGIGLIVVLVGADLWLHRRRIPRAKAFVVLGLAVVFVLFANVVRIALLVFVGAAVSPGIAQGGFHSKAGWVLYSLVALGFVAVNHRRLYSPEVRPEPSSSPAAPYLVPVVVVAAANLVSSLFTVDFPSSYPLTALAGGVAIVWAYKHWPETLRAPNWSWAFAVGLVAYALWLFLLPEPELARTQARVDSMWAGGPWFWAPWIFARIAGSVLVAPVVEELAFRGFLLRWVADADFSSVPYDRFVPAGILVSSVAFGLLHSAALAGVAVGILYAAAQLVSGRLETAVVAHAVTNACLVVHVLAGGAWWLWL